MKNRANTIMSLLALFAALGGSAYAAVTVTGKDVKNGSLTGRDVRDASISVADLHRSARTQATSVEGPAGPAGPAGAPGLASVAVTRRFPGTTQIGSGASKAVARVEVPAGSWVINAGGVLANLTPDSKSARCTLDLPSSSGARTVADTGSLLAFGSPAKLPFSLGGAIEAEQQAELLVFCGTNTTGSVVAQQMTITATKVAAVEDQTRSAD